MMHRAGLRVLSEQAFCISGRMGREWRKACQWIRDSIDQTGSSADMV